MPPLDRMRKIRRDILRSINDYREQIRNPGLLVDILGNRAANEYAEYLLDNDENDTVLKEICARHMVVGDVIPCVGLSMLEEDDNEDKVLYNEFMDAHGLLVELGEELEKL